MDGSIIFDPEKIGFVIQRLPASLPFSGRNFDDYQDIPLWRSLNIRLIRFAHRFRRSIIIVPMAFSNLEILNEFRQKLEKKNIEVRHFCLIAPQAAVFERLEKRGVKLSSVEGKWIYPKAAYCCQSHLSQEYREQINTEEKNPFEVAEKIIERADVVAALRRALTEQGRKKR
jgi:hypothetical protein